MADQIIGLALKCGEYPGRAHLPCAMCGAMSSDGIFGQIVNTPNVQGICFQCVAKNLYRYQELNPGKTLLEVDMNIEGPELYENLVRGVDGVCRKLGINAPAAFAGQMADMMQEVLDGNKFEEIA